MNTQKMQTTFITTALKKEHTKDGFLTVTGANGVPFLVNSFVKLKPRKKIFLKIIFV